MTDAFAHLPLAWLVPPSLADLTPSLADLTPSLADLTAASADHLAWALSWPWLLRLLPILGAVAIVILAAVNLRALRSPKRKAALLALRALTVFSLVLVLFQPTWVARSEKPGGRRLAVVVDRSESMDLGPEGARRWETALAAVAALQAVQPVTLYTVAEHLEPVASLQALRELAPSGTATDLFAALQGLGEAHRLAGLSGVVLVTDGIDNGLLHARNPSPGGQGGIEKPDYRLDVESAAVVEHLRVPVHGLYVTDKAPPRDVSVAGLRGSTFGFTRTYMPLAVDLEISGYAGREGTLALQLSDNGRPVSTTRVPLDGPPRRTIDLEFQPLHVGPHLLEAAAIALPDEATDANNRAYASLRVVRDRTRVLHLAGHPSWDTRFLRTHLRGSPAVDLVSFYVMVGQGSGAYVEAEDTTLIPFPTREIFETSLTSFDLVVFQDFPFGPFQVEHYLPELRAYVQGGGAFLVLGGRQALSAGGYYGTAIADWLPLRLSPLSGDDAGFADGPLSLKLTPAGATHPVTRLAESPETNAAIWARHALHGRNTGLQAGEGGNVLVTDAAGHPLLAVGEAGEGRSAVVATDSLWTWAFPPSAGEGARDRSRDEYHRLLEQLSAWLLRDPDLDALRIEPPGEAVPANEPVRLRVSARGASGQPLPGLTLRWAVAALTDVPSKVQPTRTWPEATDERGEATLLLRDAPPGASLVVVEATVEGRPQRATAPIVVAASARELARLQPNDALLKAVARASGGQFWTQPPKGGVPVPVRDPTELAEQVHTDLWNHPAVLVWLVGLLAAEWILRRRWGLA